MRSLFLTLATVLPLTAQELPPTYVCGRTETPPTIDGKGDDWQWQTARELSPLRDIEGAAIPHECRIKMLWDDDNLYILADMDEKHLWATLTEHDSVIYRDPDFEVFIDPDGDGLNYIELEINALNTTWDLFITRPYRFDDPHILHDWEIPGLKHAVNLRGTLNDSRDTDEGWSVELAIPWSSITSHATQPRTGKAPAPGTEMRFNFSRVNWQVRPADGGYEKLNARQKFIISDGNLDAVFNGEIFSTGSGVHVVNKTGSMLPETGGLGTLLFTVLGSTTALGTGVVLVTKKRMSMIQD